MMKQITKTLLLIVLMFISTISIAQTTINYQNTLTPQDLVNNILLGMGVTASNVTFNGQPGTSIVSNAESFTSTGFPFSSGVYIETAGGSSVSSDSDLAAIATNSIENGGILEFDFVAAGNNLSFDYMFASEEYPTFVCSDFNDVFGFFISGPGISGPYSNGAENLAIIPNSANIPVAINTVNSGTAGGAGMPSVCAAQDPNWQSNSVYFTTQYADYGGEFYNGGTVSLPAGTTLQCGETYHIKIAISNVGDMALNSGVYLKANSFVSDAVQVVVASVTGDTTVYEGCTEANIMFIRPEDQTDTVLNINYTVGGTATMGTDYNNLPNPVSFGLGVDTVIITIDPFSDGIPDNNETIEITATIINDCGDTVTSTGILVILDSVVLELDVSDTTVFCIRDSVAVNVSSSGGFGQYTYNWSNGGTDSIGYLATVDSTQGTNFYTVTATDVCGYTGTDTVYLTVDQTIHIDSFLTSPATCQPVGTISTLNFPYGGHLQNPSDPTSYALNFNWTYKPDTMVTFPNQSALNNLSSGWYILELTDAVISCTVTDSVFVDIENVPSAQLSANPGSGCSPLAVTFENSSLNSNQYFWDFGDGQTTVTNDLSSVNYTFNVTSVVQLVASNGNTACNDTSTVLVEIVECGCTNPDATNYNPNAVIDDGSCVMPIPTVSAPNVITLNGDGINDLFFLDTEHAASIELTILDRWGNVVYEGNGAQATPPMWNGTNKSGSKVTDGVYFYKYKVTGQLGDLLEGHGFLTVVR